MICGYITSSFRSDYNISLNDTKMHLWEFYDLLNGLTEDCVLSRVRYIRDFDITEIKDTKERDKMIKMKRSVALKRNAKKPTSKQQKSYEEFMKLAKLKG